MHTIFILDFIPDPLYLPTDENPSNFENFIIKEEISSSESESKGLCLIFIHLEFNGDLTLVKNYS